MFQIKIECTKMFLMEFCQHGSNLRQKFQTALDCSGRVTKMYVLLSLHSLKAKDIGHNMRIGNLISVVNSVTVPNLICYNSLLQYATDVNTKCDSYFITKYDKSLLQNAWVFLLQNATVLLQNATVITNCDNFITICYGYYKMRRLLQITTV